MNTHSILVLTCLVGAHCTLAAAADTPSALQDPNSKLPVLNRLSRLTADKRFVAAFLNYVPVFNALHHLGLQIEQKSESKPTKSSKI
jgi:hypothetical protein